MKDKDRYFDIKGLSEYSSLSVRTLRDYIANDANPLPSYCIKRKILVKQSEFDDWINKYRKNTNKVSQIAEEILNDIDITYNM